MSDGGFLDPKKPQLHRPLGWCVIICSFALDEVAVLTKFFKQTVLADFDTVAFEDFRQLTNKNGALGDRNRIGEDNLWFILGGFQLQPFLGSSLFLKGGSTLIHESGSFINSSNLAGVTYAPCLRMVGSTSWVTQRLNFLASGLRDNKIML